MADIKIVSNEEIVDVSVSSTTQQETTSISNKISGVKVFGNETMPNQTLTVINGSTIAPQSIPMDALQLVQLIIKTGGFIRSGQTDYDTGSGFWMGTSGGTTKLSIGNSAGNKVTWDGTTLSISGGISVLTGAITLGDGVTASGTITMSLAPTKGDCYIAGGTFDPATWTATNGFILGLDDSDSDREKFFIGSAASSLDWNVSSVDTMTVKGTINATAGYIGASTAAIFESTGLNLGTTGHVRGGQTAYNTGAGFFLGYDTTTYKLSIGDSTDVNNLLLWTGSELIVNGSSIANTDIFGDGSDGNVTISSNTNLTRDMYYNNLTISATKTLNPSGFRIFVKGTLTIEATAYIARSGNTGGNGGNGSGFNPGSAGSAGTALAAGSIIGSIAGAAGGAGGAGGTSAAPVGGAAGSAGTAGNDGAKSIGSDGKAGVTGGAGGSGGGGAGGAGGGAGAKGSQTGTVYNTVKNAFSAYYLSDTQSSTLTNFTGTAGTGGSGGGGGGTAEVPVSQAGGGGGGGGSGSCGGVIWIAAKNIVLAGSITATGGTGGNGGNGANAAFGNAGGGGGGGAGSGGGGGVIILIYGTKSGAGSLTTTGGSGGTIGSGGNGNGTGTNGTNGTAGNTGETGITLELEV